MDGVVRVWPGPCLSTRGQEGREGRRRNLPAKAGPAVVEMDFVGNGKSWVLTELEEA